MIFSALFKDLLVSDVLLVELMKLTIAIQQQKNILENENT
jgi:hypothetical protein